MVSIGNRRASTTAPAVAPAMAWCRHLGVNVLDSVCEDVEGVPEPLSSSRLPRIPSSGPSLKPGGSALVSQRETRTQAEFAEWSEELLL